jgi:hypothetical protein
MGPQTERPLATRRQRDVTQAAAPALGASDLATYEGDYYSEEVDATYHVTVVDGALQFSGRHIPAQRLTPTAADTFEAGGGLTLHFERPSAGVAPTAFTIEAGRVRNIRFVRR